MTGWKEYRQKLEFPLTRLGMALIPRLPRRLIVGLARLLGRAAYLVAARERRVGLANLDVVYGATLTAAEKQRILRGAFQTFALVLLDVFWFSRRTAERLRRHVHFDASLEPMFVPAAQICITAHLGNWEIVGMAVTLRGFPLTSVAAPLANPAVDRMFIASRQLSGQVIVPQQGALRQLLKALRHNGKIALVLDQNTPLAEGGMFVPFFGLPAPVSSAPALLALRTGADIFTGGGVPDAHGEYTVFINHRIRTADYASLPEAEALRALTEETVRGTEALIRAHPDKWLWMYKRWKHALPGDDRSRYPYYTNDLPAGERAILEKGRGTRGE